MIAPAPHACRPAPRPRPGLTLVELMTSLAITSVLLVAAGSAIVLTGMAAPSSQSPGVVAGQGLRALDQFAAELESALYIVSRSPTAISFTVADRNGDGRPERIRYAWSGVKGAALTRGYNGASPTTALESVDEFSLLYDYRSISESYDGAGVEDAFDSLLLECGDDDNDTEDYEVRSNALIGQYLKPDLTPGIMSWRPTRVRYRVRAGDAGGVTRVQLRTADANLKPTSTVLEEASLENVTSSIRVWSETTFSQISGLPIDEALCLVLQRSVGSPSTSIVAQFDDDTGPGRLTSSDGTNWTYDNDKTLRCQLFGRLTRPGPLQSATHKYLTHVLVTLRPSPVGAAPLATRVQILNRPQLLAGYWEADFSTNPTSLDVNGDGVGDWVRADGQPFSVGTLSNGIWQADAALNSQPDHTFPGTTIVEVRMRNTSVGGNGAVFWINPDWTGSTAAALWVSLRLQGDGTQTLTLHRKTSDANSVVLATVPRLPAEMVDLRLLINADLDCVHMHVNDVDRGTYAYTTFTPSPAVRQAGLLASGSAAQFDHVRIRVLEAGP